MSGLLNTEDPLNPGNYLVRGRVGRLVEVDDTITDVVFQRTLEGRVPGGNGRVMPSANEQLVIILRSFGQPRQDEKKCLRDSGKIGKRKKGRATTGPSCVMYLGAPSAGGAIWRYQGRHLWRQGRWRNRSRPESFRGTPCCPSSSWRLKQLYFVLKRKFVKHDYLEKKKIELRRGQYPWDWMLRDHRL